MVLFFYGCILLYDVPPILIVEKDEIKSTTRTTFSQEYRVSEKHSTVVLFGKTFFKETNLKNESVVKVYDVLKLKKGADQLEKTIYLVADQKMFPIRIDHIELENSTDIHKETHDIMKADSTKVTVITGYNEYNYTIHKFNYILSDEMIQSIAVAQELKFRYYSGMNMITVKIKDANLKKVKKLVHDDLIVKK